MKQPEAKREKMIKIRVSAEELETLKWHCPKHRLAEWMREHCLNPDGDMVRKNAPKPPAVDPQLLRQLAGIGNNINQIARAVNRSDVAALDAAQIIAGLADIRDALEKIRSDHR